jgi:DNA invertase Pin-like site-specific DNA recombinase
MSRLILGVMSSVAELERDLIRERTRLGWRRPAAGKRISRPRVAGPDATVLERLSDAGRSETELRYTT